VRTLSHRQEHQALLADWWRVSERVRELTPHHRTASRRVALTRRRSACVCVRAESSWQQAITATVEASGNKQTCIVLKRKVDEDDEEEEEEEEEEAPYCAATHAVVYLRKEFDEYRDTLMDHISHGDHTRAPPRSRVCRWHITLGGSDADA